MAERETGLRRRVLGTIAADDQDRAAFVTRLGTVALATGTTLYTSGPPAKPCPPAPPQRPAGLPPLAVARAELKSVHFVNNVPQ